MKVTFENILLYYFILIHELQPSITTLIAPKLMAYEQKFCNVHLSQYCGKTFWSVVFFPVQIQHISNYTLLNHKLNCFSTFVHIAYISWNTFQPVPSFPESPFTGTTLAILFSIT